MMASRVFCPITPSTGPAIVAVLIEQALQIRTRPGATSKVSTLAVVSLLSVQASGNIEGVALGSGSFARQQGGGGLGVLDLLES